MMYAFGKLHTCMINLQLDQYHHYYVIEHVLWTGGGQGGWQNGDCMVPSFSLRCLCSKLLH